MRQREAPLAIVHADLRKMVLDNSRHYFSITGSYSIQVKNVSNVALIDVDVRLITGTSAGSVGGGLKLKSPLSPGAVATLTDRFVNGEGTMIGDEEPALHLFVESVRTSDCVYQPAKTWASVPK